MTHKPILSIIVILLLFSCTAGPQKDLSTPVIPAQIRIAAGSCSKQTLPQSYWDTIAQTQPDLWLWLGDAVYSEADDSAQFLSDLKSMKQNPFYANFRTQIPVTGIWDDHDYGTNDGNKHFAHNHFAQNAFLNFLDDTLISQTEQEGIYRAMYLHAGKDSVLLVMLDTRFFKDAPSDTVLDKTVLGTKQWDWLHQTLSQNQASFCLIASGIQVIPEEHRYETWGQFPQERARLLNLPCQYPQTRFVILSGDRHIAEWSHFNENTCQESIWELTTSGLTHSYFSLESEPNRFRMGPLITQKNFGLIDIDLNVQKLEIQIMSTSGETLYRHMINP